MARPMDARPTIALTAGDPAGIGPEIVAAALADAELARSVRLVAVGPAAVRPEGIADFDAATPALHHAWLATEGPRTWRTGEVQESCGRAALAALRAGAELAASGAAEALVTGPVSKAALHLAGERAEGQTELLARWAGVARYEMIGVAGRLRAMLASRHLPLREAIAGLTTPGIVERLVLFDETLRRIDGAAPRLALAGLNPHAGEGGLLGAEEGELLVPAVEEARRRGVQVEGPRSPDTVFAEAAAGRWDGVLALYHDQGFIPLKLLSAGRGFTVVAGLPYLRLSPVHGTAFDIAGTGRASPENLFAVLRQAALWAAVWAPARS